MCRQSILAIGACAYGTVACEMSTAERKFFGLAALYMTSAGFTLAKTYRDRLLADLLEDVDRTAAVCSALRGTDAWGIQVVASFVLAVCFSFHTLLTSVGSGNMTGDPGFAVTACIFAVVVLGSVIALGVTLGHYTGQSEPRVPLKPVD